MLIKPNDVMEGHRLCRIVKTKALVRTPKIIYILSRHAGSKLTCLLLQYFFVSLKPSTALSHIWMHRRELWTENMLYKMWKIFELSCDDGCDFTRKHWTFEHCLTHPLTNRMTAFSKTNGMTSLANLATKLMTVVETVATKWRQLTAVADCRPLCC